MSGLLNCCQMMMQIQAENMKSRKKMTNLKSATVVISGVNLLIGEKRRVDFDMSMER